MKFLIKARYTQKGIEGLKEEGGNGRKESISNALNAIGGKLESLYFTTGKNDVIVIAEVPDAQSIAALTLTVGASGSVRTKTQLLLTPDEVDKATKQKVNYRAPGQS